MALCQGGRCKACKEVGTCASGAHEKAAMSARARMSLDEQTQRRALLTSIDLFTPCATR